MKVAIVLLSGGLDSCIAATMKAKEKDTDIYLLSIDYESPPSKKEQESRNKVVSWLKTNFSNVKQYEELKIIGYMKLRTIEKQSLIPQGYPFTRDETFMLLAASWLERLLIENDNYKNGEVVIATTKEDTFNFEDILPEIYTSLNEILDTKYSNKVGKYMKISTPLIHMMKHEVIKKGIELKVPLELTWSCYFGEEYPCQKCDQCKWRAEAFKKAEIKDPLFRK